MESNSNSNSSNSNNSGAGANSGASGAGARSGVRYLSPSSIHLYLTDRAAWMERYIDGIRHPQTPPMMVGSAFDAYIKTELGGEWNWGLEVEPGSEADQWAHDVGKDICRQYMETPAYKKLVRLIKRSGSPLMMEERLERELFGVPVIGYPDLAFAMPGGGDDAMLVLDWKVNGYCSKRGASPKPGYVSYAGGPPYAGRGSRPACQLSSYRGIDVSKNYPLPEPWMMQCVIYGWLLGVDPSVVMIHQLVCKPDKGAEPAGPGSDSRPSICVAEHACVVTEEYKKELAGIIQNVWADVSSMTGEAMLGE